MNSSYKKLENKINEYLLKLNIIDYIKLNENVDKYLMKSDIEQDFEHSLKYKIDFICDGYITNLPDDIDFENSTDTELDFLFDGLLNMINENWDLIFFGFKIEKLKIEIFEKYFFVLILSHSYIKKSL